MAVGALAAVAAAAATASGRIPHLQHFPPERHATLRRILGPAYSAQPAPAAGRVFRPTDFGADDTGREDSSKAFADTFAAVVATAGAEVNGLRDLGGAFVDLAGGNYSVSGTVSFPAGYGNFEFGGGTLRASASFPLGATLLRFGSESGEKGKAVQNLDVSRITLDGGDRRAGVALDVANGQYVNVGPAVMVYGFSTTGISMNGTGGCYVHHSWLGEIPPGASGAARKDVHATAISLESGQHDCYVDDVIVWSGRVGVRSANGANQIQGVHTWNLAVADGGTGILLESGMGKVIDSYLDFCPLVVKDPKSVAVSNNLFLATANLVVQAGASGTVKNMVVTGNRWWSENKYSNATIVQDGVFKSIEDSVIESNSADAKWAVKSTRATRSAAVSGRTQLLIDFSEDLAFDTPITEARCEVLGWEAVAHSVHPPTNRSVVVELAKAVPNGHVVCTVDQSTRTHAAH